MSGLGLRQGHVGVWVVTPEGGFVVAESEVILCGQGWQGHVPLHQETIVLGCQTIFSKRLGEDLLLQGRRA